jgi:hypothetical protein
MVISSNRLKAVKTVGSNVQYNVSTRKNFNRSKEEELYVADSTHHSLIFIAALRVAGILNVRR